MQQHVKVNEGEDEITFVKKATKKGTTKMKPQNRWSHYLDNTCNQPLKKVTTIAKKMKSCLWEMMFSKDQWFF